MMKIHSMSMTEEEKYEKKVNFIIKKEKKKIIAFEFFFSIRRLKILDTILDV